MRVYKHLDSLSHFSLLEPGSATQERSREWCPSQALPAAAAGGSGAVLCHNKGQNITFLQGRKAEVLSGELASQHCWALYDLEKSHLIKLI